MNIFSNIGITELIVILLLALLVVGPERLPEFGRQLAKTLRDLRKAYENLTKEIAPELMSLQESTRELRESVDSVRSIPKDMVESVVKAADLDDTIAELKEVTGDLEEVRQTVAGAGQVVKDPVGAAVRTARGALQPPKPAEEQAGVEEPIVKKDSGGEDAVVEKEGEGGESMSDDVAAASGPEGQADE
jgi:sec-independent protein translocase protein TatB